ncbi:polycomb group protein EMBRYONIC FLOWER 2-like [Trifolium pratense]|uniref:polycomb group protein EMBRYONIC FLOWER 2-like n=1 Tax=Trifolium pratense TaxID=57577 RepID=UPI001E694232|nr:polycomb group protein EMBRYONIC FLOWER 2-like [Trifolium pratense]
MPGFPVAAGETCNFISTDQQPSPVDASVQLSAEEKAVAEQSLSVYCKPVEFYNILHHRILQRNPFFIPRCLEYRREARRKKRTQMTVMLSWNDEETQNVFPLYIGLARRDPNNVDADYSAVYLLSQIYTFRGSSSIDRNYKIKAEFVLWEVNELAADGSLFLLFFTTEGNSNSSPRVNASLGPSDPTSHESIAEKICLYEKISFQSIYMAWDSSPNFLWGLRAEVMTTLDLLPCILKYDVLNKGTTIAIQELRNSEIVSTSKHVQIKIFAEELMGMEKSLNYTNVRVNVPSSSSSSSSSSSRFIRLKEGHVKFNYRYFDNKLQRTEDTEDFSCPLCYLRCASYKGLRCHLLASHDLFNYEFSALEHCLAVNVSLNYDTWRTEIIGDDVDPRLQTFYLRCKRYKHTSPEVACFEEYQGAESPALANNADPPVFAMDVDPPVFAMDADPPVFAMDADPLVLAMDVGPPVLANDTYPPNLTIDADPPVLAIDADPPILAIDMDPPVLAIDADQPILPIDADPPVLAMDADPPVLVKDADQPVLAIDADPPLLAKDADPPVLAIDADPPAIATDADQIFLESETPLGDIEFLKKADGNSATISGVANENVVSNPDPDCVPPISEHDYVTPAVPQADNAAKLDDQSKARLVGRKFYHSHKAQEMSIGEVLSDYDSENEIDPEVEDIEERMRLNLHDVSKEEKEFMFMWNSFIRKQRVLVDSHVRWACKAFSILHGAELVKSRELSWFWRMFRLKLYNFGLIDGKVMNDCSIILEQYEKQKSNPEIPIANINSILLTPRKSKRRK